LGQMNFEEDSMSSVSTAKARERLSTLVERVSSGKERVVLTRRGKAVAALVSVEDLATLESIEDRQDLEDARRALADPERIPYEEVRRKLGLK
jgi:antitoxin Phd